MLNFVEEPKVNCNHCCDTPSPVTSHILLSVDGEFIADSFEIPRIDNISICVYGIFLEGEVEGNTTIVKTV